MASSDGGVKASLVVGNKLLCPKCEGLGDVLTDFAPMDREKKYEDELNLVYVHRRDYGGCGHCFSPGEPRIMAAYLSGELVLKPMLDEALAQLRFLREQYERLQSQGSVAA